MRISEITIDSFGHWKGLRVPDLAPGVTVIYGPNEAGKSTLLQLIRAVLYGFSPAEHRRFVPPVHGGRAGGSVLVAAPSGKFRIRRRLPAAAQLEDSPQGDLEVKTADGMTKGKHLVSSLLSGVDETLFQSVFAVGLTEIQQLGTLSDTEAAQQLFGLATGSDRVSIADVARRLVRQRTALIEDTETGVKPNLARKSEVGNETEQAQKATELWLELRDARHQVTTELRQLEKRRGDFGKHVDGVRPNDVVRQHWKECQVLEQRLKKLGPLPDIPSEALQRLDKLTQQVSNHRQQWEKLRERRRSLKTQAQQLEHTPSLLQHGEPIDALHRQSASMGSLHEELTRLRTRFDETEFELQAEMERHGMNSAWQLESMPLITHEVVEALREPARQARDARRELEAAQRDREAGGESVQRVDSEIEKSLGGVSGDLTATLNNARSQAHLLSQQIENESQLVRLRRTEQEVLEEIGYWTQRQVLSWRGLLVIGALFSLGVVVMLVSMFYANFGIPAEHRWMVMMLGGGISFTAIVIKNVVAMAAVRRADACRDESDELHARMDGLKEQMQTAAEQLPSDSRPLSVRLQEKQNELDQFSDLKPLEMDRQAAQQQVEEATARIEAAERRLREARSRWRDTLRRLGLPEGMTPTQFGRLSQQGGNLGTLRGRFLELKQEIEQREQDLAGHTQRVKLLAERIDVVFDSNTLEDQIDELVTLLRNARGQLNERQSLHRSWKQLSQEQEKIARGAKRLQQRRRKLVAKYGLIDAHELKQIVHRRTQANQFASQRDKLVQQISERLGVCVSADDLRRQLNDGGFEDHLRSLESEHGRVTTRIAELHERRGELNEKLKSLARNRQGTTIRLEENEIEQQLSAAVQQWATSAGVSRALSNVQAVYESDQQPETLAEASGFLSRMTGGKYQRTWTPFGESSLCVDNSDGQSAGIEVLSRGTREQVFLSLRLALAAAYSRRGAPMPVILDDVLVNFDASRSRAAAEAICEFAAAGRQVLVFTCHDHIRDVFKTLDVDVRSLPSPKTVAEKGGDVLPDPSAATQETEPPVEPSVQVNRFPADGDRDLDHELVYGAPEYDPGYGWDHPDHELVEVAAEVEVRAAPADSSPPASAVVDWDWAERYNAEINVRR